MATKKTTPQPPPTLSELQSPEDVQTVEEMVAEKTPAATPSAKKKAALVVTYVGGAMDHEVTPEKLAIGRDGKPKKRAVIVPAQLRYFEARVKSLYGIRCEKGKPVEIDNSMLPAGATLWDVHEKAKNLECFEIEADLEAIKKPVKRRRVSRR